MILVRRTLVQNREILRLLPRIYRCAVFGCKDGFCHGFAAIYAAVTCVSFFGEDVLEKDAISTPDASDALGIMTDALLFRIRKNYCFLL